MASTFYFFTATLVWVGRAEAPPFAAQLFVADLSRTLSWESFLLENWEHIRLLVCLPVSAGGASGVISRDLATEAGDEGEAGRSARGIGFSSEKSIKTLSC